MQTEKLKWKNHESESTEAEPRGGTTRSSGEVPETGWSEGVVSRSRIQWANQQWEEPVSEAKPFVISALRENLTDPPFLRNFCNPLHRDEPTLVTAIRLARDSERRFCREFSSEHFLECEMFDTLD
jgi:hypothetical protein